MRKRHSVIIYLMMRAGLRNEVLRYINELDDTCINTVMKSSLIHYLNNDATITNTIRNELIQLTVEYETMKDSYALLLCHIMMSVDIIGKYHDIDCLLKYSLDDYIWYHVCILKGMMTYSLLDETVPTQHYQAQRF